MNMVFAIRCSNPENIEKCFQDGGSMIFHSNCSIFFGLLQTMIMGILGKYIYLCKAMDNIWDLLINIVHVMEYPSI